MAGSKKYVRYQTDIGDMFFMVVDESNHEAVNGTSQDFIPADVGVIKYGLPRSVQPRYAVYGTGFRRLKVAVSEIDTYNTLESTVPTIADPLTSGQTLTLISKTPERRVIPRPDDTGLNDGDAT